MIFQKLKNKNINLVNIIPTITLIVICILTVAYAAFSNNLAINDIGATVRVQEIIRVTGVTVTNPVSNAISNYEDYNINNINSSVTLPNSDSKITYEVQITNYGNTEMIVKDITGLPENLKYTLDTNNYQLQEVICDDNDHIKCTLGAVKTIYITVEYKTPQSYDSTNITFPFTMNFTFESANKVAQIDNVLYDTLQKAINAVPTDNTVTTIKLLKNTSEIITVASNKNIVFNFGNHVLSNNGNNPVVENNGTITFTNGTITSNAPTNGAFNNNATGKITISGGSIIVTGGRQALYNNNGVAEITGDAYLSSAATERAAVQNLADGTMTITGGTIVSTGSSGVVNAGTLTIGIENGNITKETPIIQGVAYGVNATADYSFYDGTLKGRTQAFNDITYITNKETGYEVASSEETINDQKYRTAFLAITSAVTFNPNGGIVSESSRNIEKGQKIGTLPIPTRVGYEHTGWFTAANGGTQIDENTIINNDVTYYAHWIEADFAMIGDTKYETLQAAINDVPNNVETTIKLLRNTAENVTVSKNKNIIFDFQTYTLSNAKSTAVIENSGTIKIINGNITSNASTGTINNNSGGRIIVSGGSIIATGTRQAIYNNSGGTVEITGDAYLSSTAAGKPTGSNMERATVQNLAGGTLIITGGTVVGVNQQAVSNEGTLTVGTNDGTINAQTPVIMGKTYGLKNASTFNFYDGIIKGITGAISGTITNQETNSQIVNGTETINGKTYKTQHLEISN